MKQQKISLRKIKNFPDKYKVIKLTNRLKPTVGDLLTKTQVEALLDIPDLNVEILPEK